MFESDTRRGGGTAPVVGAADRYGRENGAVSWATWEQDLDDGNTVHTRVGSYRANPFGLHDVIGNLTEWCLDDISSYATPGRTGDGARLVQDAPLRADRGGNFNITAQDARSANRNGHAPALRYVGLGCRPARDLPIH